MTDQLHRAKGSLNRLFLEQFNSVMLSQLQIVIPGLYQLGRSLSPKAFAPIERAFPMEATMQSAVLLTELFGVLSLNMQRSAFRILQKYWKSKSKKS